MPSARGQRRELDSSREPVTHRRAAQECLLRSARGSGTARESGAARARVARGSVAATASRRIWRGRSRREYNTAGQRLGVASTHRMPARPRRERRHDWLVRLSHGIRPQPALLTLSPRETRYRRFVLRRWEINKPATYTAYLT